MYIVSLNLTFCSCLINLDSWRRGSYKYYKHFCFKSDLFLPLSALWEFLCAFLSTEVFALSSNICISPVAAVVSGGGHLQKAHQLFQYHGCTLARYRARPFIEWGNYDASWWINTGNCLPTFKVTDFGLDSDKATWEFKIIKAWI